MTGRAISLPSDHHRAQTGRRDTPHATAATGRATSSSPPRAGGPTTVLVIQPHAEPAVEMQVEAERFAAAAAPPGETRPAVADDASLYPPYDAYREGRATARSVVVLSRA